MECLYDEILLKVKVVFVIMAYLTLIKVDCSCLLSDHFFNTIGMQRERLSY